MVIVIVPLGHLRNWWRMGDGEEAVRGASWTVPSLPTLHPSSQEPASLNIELNNKLITTQPQNPNFNALQITEMEKIVNTNISKILIV